MPETSVGGMVPAVFGPYGSLQGLCRSLLKSRAEPGHRGPMCLKGRLFLEQVGVPLLQMPSATHWGLGHTACFLGLRCKFATVLRSSIPLLFLAI